MKDGYIDEEYKTPAQQFNTKIKDKAQIGKFSGKQVVTIPGIKLLVPRYLLLNYRFLMIIKRKVHNRYV